MNVALLHQAARLSALVYEPLDVIEAAEPGSVFFDSDDTGAQAVLFPGEGRSFLVWRGTEFTTAPDLGEWITDIAANARSVRTDWPRGGTVHRGYAAAVRSLAPDISRELERVIGVTYVTGHSMGGVAATIYGSLAVLPTISFGAPSPGDADFWPSVPLVARVVLGHDPAPKYPPPWWPWSYRQSNEFHHLWDDGRISQKTWKTWSHGVVRPFTKRGLMLAAKWHDVEWYVRAIRRVADA